MTARTFDCVSYIEKLQQSGYKSIMGIDEAGRGSLAGPVIAAAVILPAHPTVTGLDDSKRLSPRRRETLCRYLCEHPNIHIALAAASVEEIEHLNILGATHLAMKKAAEALTDYWPDFILVDGPTIPALPYPAQGIIEGDRYCPMISAASIVAKVHRDRLMLSLDQDYPEYAFSQHKGYGTKAHLHALRTFGPSPVHRKHFAPVRTALRQSRGLFPTDDS